MKKITEHISLTQHKSTAVNFRQHSLDHTEENILRLFGKYPAMGVALYRWSVMA